jgi:hypothetical protein
MSAHRPLYLAALLALGCSSRQPQPTTETPAPQAVVTTADAGPATPASPWDALDRDALARIVTEGATRRVHEAQPDFDLARLDAHLADIEHAPELAGRTCDQLFDLAIVAMARGENDRAAGIVRYVRAKARNRNQAFAGSTILAELARRGAGADEAAQQRAIEEVFRALPRARFGAATVVFGLSSSLAVSVAALAVAGASDMVSVVIRQHAVQVATPDAMRGRVSAVNLVFVGASNELGEFESGVTAQLLGPVRAVVVGCSRPYSAELGRVAL